MIPNDQFFTRQWALKNDGATYQGSGTPGADIKANLAWDIVTGSSTVKIGIVDIGMQANHPDFNGRVTGDAGDNSGHGTVVAGIAAAQGNNGIGIAGVAWNVGIINEDYGSNYSASDADIAAAVRSASNRGAQVINNSWRLKDPIGRYSTTVRLAFSDIYKLNRTAVAAMGNEYSELAVYPAAFGQGIIAVGATTNTDVKADYSNTGSWIDVTAPGGGGFGSFNEPQDYILSTVPGSGYAWYVDGVGIGGTSIAAPHVTGLAALSLSYNSTLYNDDIEQIIRLGVDDVNSSQFPGFDNFLGTGRINAKKALDYLRSPYSVNQWSVSGGTIYQTTNNFGGWFYGLPGAPDGYYIGKKYEVRKSVSFSSAFSSVTGAWGRGVATIGYDWSPNQTNFTMGYCEIVPGTLTTTGVTLRTWVYKISRTNGTYYGWYPTSPSNVAFAYTVLGVVQPLTVTITGPHTLGWKQQGTWTANAVGGTSSYTYEWRYRYNGTGPWSDVVGTSKNYSQTMLDTDFELQVKVTSGGQSVYDTHYVYYEGIPKRESEVTTQIPEHFSLEQNYPNPFNPTTEIKFALPENGHVTLSIFNVMGQKIRILVDEQKLAGYHSVIWNGMDDLGKKVFSGIYLYRINVIPSEIGSKPIETVKKMTLLQ
ncbi:MAG: S8 family serine peptidase [bacterium]